MVLGRHARRVRTASEGLSRQASSAAELTHSCPVCDSGATDNNPAENRLPSSLTIPRTVILPGLTRRRTARIPSTICGIALLRLQRQAPVQRRAFHAA